MIFLNTLSIIIALLTWNDVGASEWWNGWSPHDNNDRYQRETLPITPTTTKTEFKQLWYTKLNGPVQMSPTVYQRYVYIATWTGTFYSLRADNGMILWQRNLSDIINNGHIYVSRTSPLVYNNTIILGLTDNNVITHVAGHGSYVIAFDRFTGVLLWQKIVSSHPASRLTSTPQLANNILFIGISSAEEGFAVDPTYPCCTFQGSVVALNASTGTFLWETKMMPDNNGTRTGYAGKLSPLSNVNFCQNRRN
jgi:polyvinyl alcohol dehydrogenase (cytochrome)